MSSLVRLEDSRLLEDWKSMEQVQSNIMNADSDLMLKQRVRHANRENLTKVLKKLNSYIDSGSKLRSENKKSFNNSNSY
jgi:regulatory protein YycH of two-component signal transduction system YycFG